MNGPTPPRAAASSFSSAATAGRTLTASVPADTRHSDGRTSLRSQRGRTRSTLLQGALLALLGLILSAFTLPASAQPVVSGLAASTPQVVAAKSSDSYQLHFHNYYSQTVSVAIMYRDYSGACDNDGGWATKGWWNIEPGGDRYVLNTKNRHVYFYAHTPSNDVVWTGTNHHMYVKNQAFRSCRDIGASTWDYVGLRHINMGSTFTSYTYPLYVDN